MACARSGPAADAGLPPVPERVADRVHVNGGEIDQRQDRVRLHRDPVAKGNRLTGVESPVVVRGDRLRHLAADRPDVVFEARQRHELRKERGLVADADRDDVRVLGQIADQVADVAVVFVSLQEVRPRVWSRAGTSCRGSTGPPGAGSSRPPHRSPAARRRTGAAG